MPPPRSSASKEKKKKKKKKSKAELEAERVESERLEALALAERERLAEEERKRAQEEARILAEHRRAIRLEEISRLASEVPEDDKRTRERALRLSELQEIAARRMAWEKCGAANYLPDARSDIELNTYLSELSINDATMEEAMSKIARTQKISTSLVELGEESRARGDRGGIERVDAFHKRFRRAIAMLIDRATAQALQDQSVDKSEIFVTATDLRTVEEARAAQAAEQDDEATAIEQAKIALMEKKMSTIVQPGMSFAARSSASLARVMSNDEKQDDVVSIVRCEDEEPDYTIAESTFDYRKRGAIRIGLWANLVVRTIRGPFKQLNFATDNVNLQLDLPKTLGTQRLGARIVYFPYEYVPEPYSRPSSAGHDNAETEEVYDGLMSASDMLVMGGVVQLEILDLPPMAQTIKPKLVVQKLTALATKVGVQHFPLGADFSSKVPLEKAATSPALNQYLRVRVRIPEGIIVSAEDLRVAWWDPSRQSWIDGTTSQVEFNAAREVGFNATRSGILAVVQPRNLDLRYAEWALDAIGEPNEVETARCRFTLVTPRFRLIVNVNSNGECRLVAPTDEADLRELLDIPFTPGRLIGALRGAGIHVAPQHSLDDKYSSAVKAVGLENKLCTEIASLAASFDFRNCHADLLARNSDRIAILVRETVAFVGDYPAGDPEYKTLLVECDRASRTCREAPTVVADGVSPPEHKCALVLGEHWVVVTPQERPENGEEKILNETHNQGSDGAGESVAPQHQEPTSPVEEQPSSHEGPAKTNHATSNTEVAVSDTEGTETTKLEASAEETTETMTPEAVVEPTTTAEKKIVHLNEDLLAGQTSHVSVMNCLKSVSSEEAIDRVSRTPVEFQEAVSELLFLTRPFSFLY